MKCALLRFECTSWIFPATSPRCGSGSLRQQLGWVIWSTVALAETSAMAEQFADREAERILVEIAGDTTPMRRDRRCRGEQARPKAAGTDRLFGTVSFQPPPATPTVARPDPTANPSPQAPGHGPRGPGAPSCDARFLLSTATAIRSKRSASSDSLRVDPDRETAGAAC